MSHTAFSSGLSVSIVLSSVSNGFSTWLSIACERPSEESYHAVSGIAATNCSPVAK